MKNVMILFSMLLLAACGSSGGPGFIAAPTSSGSTGTGSLEVRLEQGNTVMSSLVAPSASGLAAAVVAPTPTFVRVVVRNPGLSINGKTFQAIADSALPADINFALPVATGYIVDAITYVKSGSINRMIQHGQATGVNIALDTITPVTLTMAPITVSITLPASVEQSSLFDVVSTFPTPTPLNPRWLLTIKTAPITTQLHMGGGSITDVHTGIKAPASFVSGTLYAQGEFFINSNLVDPTKGESYLSWTFNFPNPTWGDPQLSTPLTVASGGVFMHFSSNGQFVP